MKIEDILTIIALFLLYSTALIGVYVNLKVKLKELEVRLTNLQEEFIRHKSNVGLNVQKLEERNTIEHDSIMVKIDALLEKVTELRVTQAKDSKTFNKKSNE
jgi:uncharacterized protein HemX